MVEENEVVTLDEQQELITWINNNYTTFLPNPNCKRMKRWYLKMNEASSNVPSCIWNIKRRIVEREGLQGQEQEPRYTDFIGCIIEEGGFTPHKDPNINDKIHTRFNAIIQLPESGGLPVYNNITFHVKERYYIVCHSGIHLHACQTVVGPKHRMILSFGFLLDKEKHEEVLKRYAHLYESSQT